MAGYVTSLNIFFQFNQIVQRCTPMIQAEPSYMRMSLAIDLLLNLSSPHHIGASKKRGVGDIIYACDPLLKSIYNKNLNHSVIS